ncbi:fatty acid cis/trans isomerase [Ningiella sp. W23]|uniref:fatty acid cis/trans isomerase n=1 Tax=Ningiella sp. W23 TaxID=3023715 RepID=UPI00375705E6
MKYAYQLLSFLLFSSLLLLNALAHATDLEALFGTPQVRERQVSDLPEHNIDYWLDVKPVVESRCVVCHACYDSPCQLKMTAPEGIDRGASKDKVYNASRIEHAQLSRLFEDATTTKQWREKGFFPVLNEFQQSKEANQQASLMYQLLRLKQEHPLPEKAILPDDFTFGYEREHLCAAPDEMQLYTEDNPLWGMPYALPGLAKAEQATLNIWLEQGARYQARAPLADNYLKTIDKWERFLNGSSRKQQLANRYIFEHLFLANIYFSELEQESINGGSAPQYFKIVRSSTPPGKTVEIIATRRPYDKPFAKQDSRRVYYRLVPMLETVVTKTHLPYALNQRRLSRWQSLFYEVDYEVKYLPAYDAKVAANPFSAFEQIPMSSRYKFMLDEAQFIIMNFIKGPVCRGQVAVNVIRDHFWVFFVNPDLPINYKLAQTIDINASALELPSAQEDIFLPLSNWIKYSEKAKKAAQEKEQFIIDNFVQKGQQGPKIDLSLIWDGQSENGHNPNAALTVFRHFDNASVHKGMLGDAPQTAWVIDYPLLEKIYYLLVAGYDVYGNAGHQLLSRLYMDFLRMDGENMFLDFLPEDERLRLLSTWYQNEDELIKDYLYNSEYYKQVGSSIEYERANSNAKDIQTQFYDKLRAHLKPVLAQQHTLSGIQDEVIQEQLTRLTKMEGAGVEFLAELTFIEIQRDAKPSLFVSLIKNNAHKTVSSMFSEDSELWPEQFNITVLEGITGSYPNALMQVNESKLSRWVDSVLSVSSGESYVTLLDEYGVRRSNRAFWAYSDRMHEFINAYNLIEAGFVDYNRLENR